MGFAAKFGSSSGAVLPANSNFQAGPQPILNTLDAAAQSTIASPTSGGLVQGSTQARNQAISDTRAGVLPTSVTQAAGSALPENITGGAGMQLDIGSILQRLRASGEGFNTPDIGSPNRFDASQIASIADILNPGASRFANDQADLIAALQAPQTGPTVADLSMAAERDRQLKAQLATAASVDGRSLPAAQRQILEQQALGGQEMARQAGILNTQQANTQQNMLAQILSGARGQDIQRQQIEAGISQANQATKANAAAQQAQLDQGANSQNSAQAAAAAQAQAELAFRTRALKEEAERARLGLETQLATTQMGGQIQADNIQAGADNASSAYDKSRDERILGAILSAGSTAATL